MRAYLFRFTVTAVFLSVSLGGATSVACAQQKTNGGAKSKAYSNRTTADAKVSEEISAAVEKHKLPGMVAAIWDDGKVTAVGAAGIRKFGSPEKITNEDLIHIGSCTKAMTATLIAMLIEEGKLNWDTTIDQVFPNWKDRMNPEFRKITVSHLLTHRSGVKANVAWHSLKGKTDTERRTNLLETLMVSAPESEPGKKFMYSNVGYALAGLLAEKVTGEDWQTLMKKRIFEPLDMKSAGFGAPGTKNSVDQPWGHVRQNNELRPLHGDNPSSLGPAGTVHCTLADWAKFAALHIDGLNGKKTLLKPESVQKLHEVALANYSCGWMETNRPWAQGRAMMHNGSNTMWYATIWLAPKAKKAYLVATNCGDRKATAAACDEITGKLIKFVQDGN